MAQNYGENGLRNYFSLIIGERNVVVGEWGRGEVKKKHWINPVLRILFTLQFSSLKPLFTLFKYTGTNVQQKKRPGNFLFVFKMCTQRMQKWSKVL
jgi:hypothetical protein